MADNTKPGQQVHKPHDLTRVQFIGAEDVQEYGELVLLTGELIGKGGQQDIPQGIFQGVLCISIHAGILLNAKKKNNDLRMMTNVLNIYGRLRGRQ